MNIKNILQETFLFSKLSDNELSEIKKFCDKIDVKKNEILFSTSEEAKYFYIIYEGTFKVFKNSITGKEQTIHIQKKGDLIAEAAIFDKKIYPASCMAIEKSRLVRIKTKDFLDFINKNNDILFKLLSSYSKRMRGLVSLIEDLSLSDIKKRFSKYLIENSKKLGNKDFCNLNISKKELSTYLGTTPETLSRTIYTLKTKGVLEIKDEKTFIFNQAELRKFSE